MPNLAPAEPVALANTQRYHLQATNIAQTFVLDVAAPDNSENNSENKLLPVVYVTDGNWLFPLVLSTVRLLALGGELPPMIVVGIGYPDDQANQVLARRARDLTPTVDAKFVEQTNTGANPFPAGITPGGAAAFSQFLQTQVKPFIAERYSVDPSDATLVGDSLGGLFALHNLFSAPESYQRYLVGSPSLWWDQRHMLAVEAEFAKTNAAALAARVFLSVGLLEEPALQEKLAIEQKQGRELEQEQEATQAASDIYKMVSNKRELQARLATNNYAMLQLTSVEFPKETHLSVIPATLSRGLRALFKKVPN